MGARTLLLAAAVAAAAATARANLDVTGAYALKVVDFGACDDGGQYPGMVTNVSLIWDDEVNETAYSGYFTTSYDYLADEREMEVSVYRWGSTGGWTKFYHLAFMKPFDFLMANFPAVFEYIWFPMGIREKPVPAGTYYMHRYWTRPITLSKFTALPYGLYKVMVKGIKDGEAQVCIQLGVHIYEMGFFQVLGFTPPVVGTPRTGSS